MSLTVSLTDLRRLALLIALCLVAPLFAASAASAVSAAERARCVSKGARVVVQNSQGGIFRTARGVRARRDGYYACLYRYGIRQRLATNDAPKRFSFAGRYFAFSRPAAFYPESSDVVPAGVQVFDLGARRRSRRLVHTAQSGRPGRPSGSSTETVGEDPVIRLVATTNGAAAWIAKPADPGGTDYQVLAVDGRGLNRPTRLLDSGPAIGRTSLRRLRKTSVRWLNAGVVKTARLRSR